MYKYILVVLLVLALCGDGFSQGTSPVFPVWKKLGDSIAYNDKGDSVYLIAGDTVIVSPAGIYWNPDTVISRALVDSIVNGYGRFLGADSGFVMQVIADSLISDSDIDSLSPDKLKIGSSSSGQVIKRAGDSCWWSDDLTGTGFWTGPGNFVILSGINDSVGIGTATPTTKLEVVGEIKTDTLIVDTILSIGGDVLDELAGTRLSVSTGALGVDLTGALINLTTEVTGELPDGNVSNTLTVTGYMQDEDVNTFAELQAWVSDKTLVNEEDVFTIDANWVNTANPWADNEVDDGITVTEASDTDTTGTKIAAALDNATSDALSGIRDTVPVLEINADTIKGIPVTAEAPIAGDVLKRHADSGVKWVCMPDEAGAGGAGLVVEEDSATEVAVTDTMNFLAPFEVTSTTNLAIVDIDPAYWDAVIDTSDAASADTAATSADEKVQDKVGAMTTGNTESGIDVTYVDATAQVVKVDTSSINNSYTYIDTINDTVISWVSPVSGTTDSMIYDSMVAAINVHAYISNYVTAHDSTMFYIIQSDSAELSFTIKVDTAQDTTTTQAFIDGKLDFTVTNSPHADSSDIAVTHGGGDNIKTIMDDSLAWLNGRTAVTGNWSWGNNSITSVDSLHSSKIWAQDTIHTPGGLYAFTVWGVGITATTIMRTDSISAYTGHYIGIADTVDMHGNPLIGLPVAQASDSSLAASMYSVRVEIGDSGNAIRAGANDTSLVLSEVSGGADKMYWDNDTVEIVTSGGDTLRLYNDGSSWVFDGGEGLTVLDSVIIRERFYIVMGTDTVAWPQTVCSDGQLLKYSTAGDSFYCANESGGGTGDDVKADTGAIVDVDSLVLQEGVGVQMTIQAVAGYDTITFAATLGTSVDLAAEVTGTLPVANGGTGATILTDHALVVGSGTGPVSNIGAMSSGQIPIGVTGADPVAATITEGEAIDISNGAGSITASAEDATSANKGVATFSTDNFLVTSGDVTVKDGGIVSAELGDSAVTVGKIDHSDAETNWLNAVYQLIDDSVWGQITIGNDSTSDHYIYFENGTTDEYLFWDSSAGRFEFSDEILAEHLFVSNWGGVGDSWRLGYWGTSATPSLYFWNNGVTNAAWLRFDTTTNQFDVSNDFGVTGNISVSGTVDGVDVLELHTDYATDSTKLDGIEAGATADQTVVDSAIIAADAYTAHKDKDGDSIDVSTYLTGNQSITLSGDATGSGATAITVTVVDDLHDHVYSNIDPTTSANWIGRVSDETGSGVWVFGTQPTFTTDLECPLVIGGTGTTSDLSLKTTSGVGATGADMHFLVGNNGGTEAMTILNDGNVGVGINSPSSIFHIKADVPGTVGSSPAGQLIIQNPINSVWSNAVITGYESDAAGNPDQQLWYFGSSSSSNSDIIMLNRRNSKLCLGTNGTTRLTIDGDGNVGIGTTSPSERLSVVGNIATGDTAAGDVDVFHYFSTNGSYITEYLKWDDGLGRFELSDDFDITGNLTLTGSIAGYFDTATVVDTIEGTIGPFIDTTTLDTIENAHHAVNADTAAYSADDFVDPFLSGDVTYTGSLIGWQRRGEFRSLDSLNIDLPDTGLGMIIHNWIVRDTGGPPLDSVYCCWGDSLTKCTVTTHPSVIWADNGIFGDYCSQDTNFDTTSPRGIMLVSPYNLGSVCENPSIIATHGKDSNGNFNWRSWGSDTTQNPIITPYELDLFCADTSNKDPNGNDYSPYKWNYFSDGTCFPGHTQKLWIAWRVAGYDTSSADTPYVEAIWTMSTDGSRETSGDDSGHLAWSDPTMILVDTSSVQANISAMLSPFVLQFTGGKYRMWVTKKIADTPNYMGMYETDGSPDAEYWDTLGNSYIVDNDTVRAAVSDTILELWHPNALAWSPNVLIGLFCYGEYGGSGDKGELYVAESNDGGWTWRVRDSVFMPYDSSGDSSWFDNIIYRAAAWWNVYDDKVTMDVFFAGNHTTSSGNWDIGHAETYWTEAAGGSGTDTVRHVAQLTTVTVEKYEADDSVIITGPLSNPGTFTALCLDSALEDNYSKVFSIRGWIPWDMTVDTIRLKVNASAADSVIIEAYVLYGPSLADVNENEALGLWWFTSTPDTLSSGNQYLSFEVTGSPPNYDSTAIEGSWFNLKLQVKIENAGTNFYPKRVELIGREIR